MQIQNLILWSRLNMAPSGTQLFQNHESTMNQTSSQVAKTVAINILKLFDEQRL